MAHLDPLLSDIRTDRQLLDSLVRNCQLLVGRVPFVGASAVFNQFRELVHETPSPKTIFGQALMDHLVLQLALRLLPSPEERNKIITKPDRAGDNLVSLLMEVSPHSKPFRSVDQFDSTDPATMYSVNHRAVEAAVAFIEQRFAEPGLRLAHVAAHVRLSRSHLDRLLKKHLGISFLGYLRRVRIRRAAELLEKSELSIKEIAAAVGYDFVSTFDRNFRHAHGRCPSEWRCTH